MKNCGEWVGVLHVCPMDYICMHVYVYVCRYSVHRDTRGLTVDMIRQFLNLQVSSYPHALHSPHTLYSTHTHTHTYCHTALYIHPPPLLTYSHTTL